MKLSGWMGRTRIVNGVVEKQPLIDHLLDTSDYANNFCKKFGAAKWGKIAGLFHDAGKCSAPFQDRLNGNPAPADHYTFGGKYLWGRIKDSVGKAMAFIICGHHRGMANALVGQTKEPKISSLSEYMTKEIPVVPESCVREFNEIRIGKLKFPKFVKTAFSRFFFIKMVHSSLVDADRLDSEDYNSPEKAALRKYESIPVLRKRLETYLEGLWKRPNPSKVDRIRTAIQKECIKRAGHLWWPRFLTWGLRGIYSLTVPTGGGKTLASLMFALQVAERLGMDRVIYVLPYTTIIEQNAEIIRAILGDNNVIEHHCHFEGDVIENIENRRRHYCAVENWDAPVIFTTNVQFFESLYTNKATRNRKIHNIDHSVVILDEAHMLPSRLLKPCVRIIRELVSYYHCTFVFCTATQPGLSQANGFGWGVREIKEIIKDPKSLYKSLERVHYEFRERIQHDNQLAYLVRSLTKVLCIVNTKKHARMLWDDVRGRGEHTYHLSTLMCAEHRRGTIRTIREDLLSEQPCRVVSTSLIECGVNLSFPDVVRNRSGIGSIIQSGGRCNREGELESGRLIITNVDHSLNDDDFFSAAEIIAMRYLRQGRNLLDNEVAQQAFVELYKNMEDKLDKPTKKGAVRLLQLIKNSGMEIPFEEIARIFRIIETATVSVIIPYNTRARDLIEQLRNDPDNFRIVRALQDYTVQVYENEYERIAYAVDTSLEPYRILADMSKYSNDYGIDVYSASDLRDYRK